MSKLNDGSRTYQLPRVTDEELATILAALSHWQRTVIEGPTQYGPRAMPEAVYFHDCEPITAEEIDELKDKINIQGNA